MKDQNEQGREEEEEEEEKRREEKKREVKDKIHFWVSERSHICINLPTQFSWKIIILPLELINGTHLMHFMWRFIHEFFTQANVTGAKERMCMYLNMALFPVWPLFQTLSFFLSWFFSSQKNERERERERFIEWKRNGKRVTIGDSAARVKSHKR